MAYDILGLLDLDLRPHTYIYTHMLIHLSFSTVPALSYEDPTFLKLQRILDPEIQVEVGKRGVVVWG